MKKFISLFLLSVLLFACAPQSKEAYLEGFKEFIDNVDKNHAEFTSEDWESAKEEYDKYMGEWYNKFEEEMSIAERMKVTSYKMKFIPYYRINSSSRGK